MCPRTPIALVRSTVQDRGQCRRWAGAIPRWRVSLLLALLVAGSAPAAEFDSERLAAIPARLQRFVDEEQIAGAVTVVGNASGIVRLDAVGLRDREAQQSMTRETLFRIASMTKPITAIAIGQLVDEGKLSFDDPVEKYLPAFQGQMLVASKSSDATTLKRPSRPITIRDLLTHTSGLPGGFPVGIANLYVTRDLSLAEAVLVSSQRPLDFEPGAKWAYCNAGIDTLGRIVEVVARQPFEEFLATRVFRPLGMDDTTFYPTAAQLTRAAAVYDQKEGKLVRATNIILGPPVDARHPIPAGGLYSTAPDLARLYQAMLLKGALGEQRILSPQSVATMTRVQTGDLACGFVPGMSFGFGWAVVKQPQGVTSMLSAGTFGHGGAFGTQGWIDPHQGLFIVLLIQRTGLKNGDNSEMRHELQRLAVEAIKR